LAGVERPLGPQPVLRGRRGEREALGGFLDGVRGGRGAVLMVHGEAGVGKTALLDYVAESASDLTVVRAVGVESEMELVFAGLHQLCAPMLDHLDRLPGPQRNALATAFGLMAGPAPDRFLVGLAVLTLMSEVAEKRPLVCLVDDVQWLDRASAQALAFAARRLLAEPVVMVFAAREPGADFDGLPELVVEGLGDADARELLASVVPWPLDEQVRERILAETRGNPLALLELPRGRTPAELAGGFALADALPLSGRIEEGFWRQLAALPAQTRRLLQLAAADPVGDAGLVWRAAAQLGIPAHAETPAIEAGLVEFTTRVRFRHPLVRAAAYRSASIHDRRDVHRALAEVTDAHTDPDRRAWHRAWAAAGPDEDVAADLERSADRAQARGGVAAAAAFLERAVTLTPDPAQRVERALAAARAKVQAGAFAAAAELLSTAGVGPLDDFQRARVDLLRAQLALATQRGADAAPLLLAAAKRLERIDIDLARTTYLDAMNAALFAGRLARPEAAVLEVARAARAAPSTKRSAGKFDLFLDGLATHFTEGYAAGLPILRRALNDFGHQMSAEEEFRWLWLAQIAAAHLWDDEKWDAMCDRHIRLARDAGALSELPLALTVGAYLKIFAGDLAAAGPLIEELQAVMQATGISFAPYGALLLAALRGREEEASALISATRQEATVRGEGVAITAAHRAAALLYNGLGRYNEALDAAEQATQYLGDLGVSSWCTVELIEAAVRTGAPERATDALRRLADITTASGTDWALGIEARSRALLSQDEIAEDLYREAIDRLGRTRMRADLARAHLLYGEWLRRENRRVDAREQLRTAYEMLTVMGIEGFAERARRELLATGETVRKRTADTLTELTAQEAHIARLARDGLSNPEISTQLFISPRTVEWHLRKVFNKLGISSRRQLRGSLPAAERHSLSA
jgi:DNA-binding CsgD family transcriptional regulator